MSIAEQIQQERNALFKLLRESRANELLPETRIPTKSLLAIGYLKEPRFYWVSHTWTNLLSYDFKELTEKSFFDFVHPEDFKRTINAFKHLQKKEEVGFRKIFPNRYRKKDGTYALIGWYDFIVLDKDQDKFSMKAVELNQEQYDEAVKLVEYLWRDSESD